MVQTMDIPDPVPNSFQYDVVNMRCPSNAHPQTARTFMDVIIRYLARHSGAALIKMSMEDLEDLFDYCKGGKSSKSFSNEEAQSPLRCDLSEPTGETSGHSKDDIELPRTKLESKGIPKGNTQTGPATSKRKKKRIPFDILLAHATDETGLLVLHIDITASTLSKRIVAALEDLREVTTASHSMIMTIISCQSRPSNAWTPVPPPAFGMPYDPYYTDVSYRQTEKLSQAIMDSVGSELRKKEMTLTPVFDTVQPGGKSIWTISSFSFEDKNIRVIKRAIRRVIISLGQRICDVPASITPYIPWSFLQGTPVQKVFNDTEFFKQQIQDICDSIRNDHTAEGIEAAIIAFGHRELAKKDWKEAVKKLQPNTDMGSTSRWAGFTQKQREKLEQVEADVQYLDRERVHLDRIADPSEYSEGWDDIAIDREVEDHISIVINHFAETRSKAQGILKGSRIGGALLYGPPGTGKTHLVRVLTKEIGIFMLCVSPADMMSKYVGDTEKTIKGLFDLARRLTPSVIFVDEADSLFRARKSDDMRWERNSSNQWLSELDSLKQVQNPPLVLLATNFPGDLDEAVLRRVPNRCHVGLPNIEMRHRILQICLKEDALDNDIDLLELAERSKGYSGSDIRHLCVQAALSRDRSVGKQCQDSRLCLHDFDVAFRRSGPTVSKSALMRIRAFARDFDPTAVDRMLSELNTKPLQTTARGSRPQSRGREETQRPDGAPQASAVATHADADISTTAFKYEPLPRGANYIRILSFDNRSGDDSELESAQYLHLSMKAVSLDDWVDTWKDLDYLNGGSFASGLDQLSPMRGPEMFLRAWFIKTRWDETINDHFNRDKQMSDRKLQQLRRKHNKECMARLTAQQDIPLERIERMDKRFNWGDYVAISYVWGDVTETRTIMLNGKRFSVHASLHTALLQLKNSFACEPRCQYFWADAICINQNDLNERADEVKKMDMIYSRCLSVRAFLGNSDTLVPGIVPMVKSLVKEDLHERHLPTWDEIEQHGLVQDVMTLARIMDNSPYWQRLWVIQEAVLAPRILFYLANETLTMFEVFAIKALDIQGFKSGLGLALEKDTNHLTTELMKSSDAWNRVILLRQLEQDLRRRKAVRLRDFLQLAQRSQCKDPRDKVYGILALVPSSIASQVKVSYELSNTVYDTYRGFTSIILKTEGNLNLLGQFRRSMSSPRALESWALDLNSSVPPEFGLAKDVHSYIGEPSSNQHLAGCSFTIRSDNTLICQGVIVDTINVLGAVKIVSHEIVDATTLVEPLQYRDIDDTVPCNNQDLRLSIARVLLQDSSYEFSADHLSPLDIPWLELDNVDRDGNVMLNTNEQTKYHEFTEAEYKWSRLYTVTPISVLFRAHFYDNAEMEIGGRPLKDSFKSEDDFCENPKSAMETAQHMLQSLKYRRLFVSSSGRLGIAPAQMQMDDIIVVLSSCNSPLVLRPRGDDYELIGSCYIDGLMNGEVAKGVDDGTFKLQEIRIR